MSPVTRLRGSLVGLKDELDHRLHPGRRARARRRLAALSPRSVTFICLGNVCRSPYAERVMARLALPGLTVDSGGFIGPGRQPADVALTVAGERGIDHSDHVSKTTKRADLEAADAIFFFDRHNRRDIARAGADMARAFWLGDFDPYWGGKRAILDPWGKARNDFVVAFDRIDRCIAEVSDVLSRRPTSRAGSGTSARTRGRTAADR